MGQGHSRQKLDPSRTGPLQDTAPNNGRAERMFFLSKFQGRINKMWPWIRGGEKWKKGPGESGQGRTGKAHREESQVKE